MNWEKICYKNIILTENLKAILLFKCNLDLVYRQTIPETKIMF